jgi:hypothetical protein
MSRYYLHCTACRMPIHFTDAQQRLLPQCGCEGERRIVLTAPADQSSVPPLRRAVVSFAKRRMALQA